MVAAISPADKTLNLVIPVSPLDTEAKTFWRLLWKMSGAIGGLN
jgi:hypothetical protein